MVNRAFLLYLFLIAGTFSIALAMPSATDIGAPNMAATQHCPLISPLLESGQKIEKAGIDNDKNAK
jgi:hypothetical protein